MRIDAGQHMRLDQRMKLTPRMIQSMEILQMASQALEERIEQELASNPTLEMREPGEDAEDLRNEREQEARDASEGERELVVSEDATDTGKDDFERLSNLSEEYGDEWAGNTYESESYRSTSERPYRDTGERDVKIDAMANTAARPESLTEQLLAQWHLAEAPPEYREAGDHLIEFIDDDGYIRTDMDTIADQAPSGVTREQLETTLTLLQQVLEPVGLAARDVRECLLLQIDARRAAHKLAAARQRNGQAGGDNGTDDDCLRIERLLVSEYLKDIEANRLPKIAKATDLDIDQVKQAIAHLRQFHPHPGRLLIEDSPPGIRPDAVIEYDETEDTYTVRLANDWAPSITISPRYSRMAKDKSQDKRTREFVNENLRSARWLVEAIQQRSSTLLRVIRVVIEAQRDFFDVGPQALKPLPMTMVADQLGIHVATVSRAVSEKYVQTPRGIYPLRMFFSGGTETEAGDSMSWTAVQAKLKEIVDAEDKSKPLSDDQLVEKLKEAGIDIARRTVAKYRKQLHIPTARQRREY